MNCFQKQRKEKDYRENGHKLDIRLLLTSLSILLITLLFASNVISVLYQYAKSPYRVEADCRYKKIRMEDMVALWEREKNGMTGLCDAAAWRFGDAQSVTEPMVGKGMEAGVVYVCGNMAVAFPASTLSGSYGQLMGDGDCAVTKKLSYQLFGSTETVGCRLLLQGKTYRIAAVTDSEEPMIFIPEKTGRVEAAAFMFQNRDRIEEKMEALGFEIRY